MAITDSTKQKIPRPEDKNGRKMYYSGKKKRHTVKNQLTVNKNGYIIHKTANHKKGRRHEYNIYKKNQPVTPKEVVNVNDLGYMRLEKDFPEQLSALPYKKKKNQELSEEEKDYNKIHSKKRIMIESTPSFID